MVAKYPDCDIQAVMKLTVFLGGPFHGALRWVERFEDLLPAPGPEPAHYRFAFGDEHIGIYYWRLNDFQVKAIRQQVTQLRARDL